MFGRISFPFRTQAPRPVAPTHDRALAPVPTPVPAPSVAPTPPVAAPLARATDPRGIRVVPLRPSSPWPLRHPQERVLNPFRAFPYRAMHLSRLMYASDRD